MSEQKYPVLVQGDIAVWNAHKNTLCFKRKNESGGFDQINFPQGDCPPEAEFLPALKGVAEIRELLRFAAFQNGLELPKHYHSGDQDEVIFEFKYKKDPA